MAVTLKEMHIHDVPADVWLAIIADAEAQGTSRTEVAVAILADEFKVRREPSGAPFRSEDGELDVTKPLKMRVPIRLREKIRVRARNGDTIRGVVVGALADRYGLPMPRTSRKPRDIGSP
jgi:hypothetical protein